MLKRIDLVGITPDTTAVLWEETGDGKQATVPRSLKFKR